MTDLRTALADAFCSNGQCGGDQSSAPCEHARMLADIAMETVAAARLEALEEAAKIADKLTPMANDVETAPDELGAWMAASGALVASKIAAAIRERAKE